MNLDERITIPLEGFLVSLEERGRVPATVRAWRRSLCRFFEFIQGEGVFNATYVSAELFFAFRNVLEAQGVRHASISRNEHRILDFFIWLAKEEG